MAAQKKVVVITGCSSGIGLATAVLLAKENNFKVLATMRNLQKRDALEEAAGTTLNKSLFIGELDISKEDSIIKFVDDTYQKEGQVDILVNNAGAGQFGSFETVSVKAMQDLFQTNVFGTCKLTQEVVKRMKKRESGHIVFISSITAAIPFPFSDFYVGSKYAIEGIAGSMAPVLRHFNIFVTCVEPGASKTEIVPNGIKNNQGSLGEPTGDERTDILWTNFRTSLAKGNWESTQEIAEAIKGCITEPTPPFRVQTSEDGKAQVRVTLADHTGEKANTLLAKMLEAK